MNIIHFTRGATDPLNDFGATGADFLPLADGHGDSRVSCVHLNPNASINAPALSHASALLVVHGRITITSERGNSRNINISAGMGGVFAAHETYTFRSDLGAILLIVGAQQISAHERAISSPQRIAGQTWPCEGMRNPS
jgi:hypothetical protein